MLKLTYIENDFRLEYLSQSLEDCVNTRVLIALRAGTNLAIEASTAAFLLPADVPGLEALHELIETEMGDRLQVDRADADYLEVIVDGTWISSVPNGEAGIFVTRLCDRAEALLNKMWQSSQFCNALNCVSSHSSSGKS